MKKLISVILALIMCVFVFSACKKDENGSDEPVYITDIEDSYKFDLSEYVTIPDTDKISVNYEIVECTDDDVQASIDSALSEAAEPVSVTDRAAQSGDELNVDYVGRYADSGEAFEGGTATGTKITLGNGGYIPGFEEGLIGMFPGEKKSVNITFPDDYKNSPDMAGVAVIFDFTLNSITENIIPELDDTYVKSLSLTDVETVDEYREYMRAKLEKTNENTTKNNKNNAVWTYLFEKCEVNKYPEDEIDEMTETLRQSDSDYAKENNQDINELIISTFGTQEEYESTLRSNAESRVKERMMIIYLCRNLDIKVTTDEYDSMLSTLFNSYGSNYGATTAAEFEELVSREQVVYSLLCDTILEKLSDNVEWIEADASIEADTSSGTDVLTGGDASSVTE